MQNILLIFYGRNYNNSQNFEGINSDNSASLLNLLSPSTPTHRLALYAMKVLVWMSQ